MVKLRAGTVTDLKKYYTMMEIDFDKRELFNSILLQKGMLTGNVQMFVIYDDQAKADVGYAVTFPQNVYGYVLLKYFGVFPWYRQKGMGKQALQELVAQYEDKYGLIAEIPVFEDNGEGQITYLLHFLEEAGFGEVPADYRIGGAKVHLLTKAMKGTGQISRVAHRILPDFYTRISPRYQTDICALK